MTDPQVLTPREAERLARRIRREFAVRLAAVVGPRALATKQKPAAFWLDREDRLNHAFVLPIRCPHRTDPCQPLILRISVNYHYADDPDRIVRRMSRVRHWDETPHYRWPAGWAFEMSVLPEEVLDFVPWVMFLAWAHEIGSSRFLVPPHPCHVWGGDDDMLERNYAWTKTAWETMEAHDRAHCEREERRRARRARA